MLPFAINKHLSGYREVAHPSIHFLLKKDTILLSEVVFFSITLAFVRQFAQSNRPCEADISVLCHSKITIGSESKLK